MKMKSILSGLIVVCSMFLAASRSQASNKATEESPMSIVNIRYSVDDIDTALDFYTRLPELARVRYLIDNARLAVDFYTGDLGLAIIFTDGAIGITNGRARAIVAA